MDTKNEMNEGMSPETVCIHKNRFAKLICKATTLEILQRAYLELEAYQLNDLLPVLLGSKKGEDDAE